MNRHQHGISRRAFIRAVALTGVGLPWISRLNAAQDRDLLNHVSFGASGMAEADLDALMETKRVRLVAVADVDLNRATNLTKKYPGIKVYQDWRQLIDKEQKNFDSANVSTPDHMHGAIEMAVLQLGKHVYGQKPLTQNVFEARQVTLQARRARVVTQMGIQIHSNVEYRLAVKLVQDQVIGRIKEVHAWSNKKWGDLEPLPKRSDPIPAGFDWDLWLGVATPRPYLHGYYHPANWRKRLDFGTGTFGDMGCHIYDPVFKALDLTAPVSLRSEGLAPNQDNWAINAKIQYVFPATAYTESPTVRVTWYDGDMRPPAEIQALLEGDKLPDQGSVFVGTKGVMLLPHIGMPQLYPLKKYEEYPMPKISSENHWKQFVDACLGEGRTSAHFDYAGPLTETVLLGGVATRFPNQTLEWNAQRMRFTNVRAANSYLKREYRKEWKPRWV
jgi:predicted dehydrogenase